MYMDHITLEDLIRYQKCEVTIMMAKEISEFEK